MPQVYLAPTYGAGWQGLDASGNPLNAGKLYTYQANSTTPLATYTTSAGTVQNANPIVLNADGRPPSEIWFIANNSYKLLLTDSAGNTIETRDNLPGVNDFSAIQNGSISLLGNVAGTNTITGTGSPTVTSLVAGQLFTLTPANNTTSTGTLQVDSTSAKNIFSGGAIAFGGELQLGVPTLLEYDGTQQNIVGGGRTGLWTPVLTFSTPGDLAVTYSVQVGTYTRIGKLVIAAFSVVTSAFTWSTGSGTVRITGLPFVAQNTNNAEWLTSVAFSGFTKANYTQMNARLLANATFMDFTASGTGQTIAGLAPADFPSGGTVHLRGTVSYLAA